MAEPPKSQVQDYADVVADRIHLLDAHAARLGERFGIPSAALELPGTGTPRSRAPAAPNSHATVTLGELVDMFSGLTTSRERIVLEKREGRWGLFFHREAPAMGPNAGGKATIVPLRDAPLSAREQFLHASGPFFRQYLDTCRERIEALKSAISAADKVLAMLEDEKLD